MLSIILSHSRIKWHRIHRSTFTYTGTRSKFRRRQVKCRVHPLPHASRAHRRKDQRLRDLHERSALVQLQLMWLEPRVGLHVVVRLVFGVVLGLWLEVIKLQSRWARGIASTRALGLPKGKAMRSVGSRPYACLMHSDPPAVLPLQARLGARTQRNFSHNFEKFVSDLRWTAQSRSGTSHEWRQMIFGTGQKVD